MLRKSGSVSYVPYLPHLYKNTIRVERYGARACPRACARVSARARRKVLAKVGFVRQWDSRQ